MGQSAKVNFPSSSPFDHIFLCLLSGSTELSQRNQFSDYSNDKIFLLLVILVKAPFIFSVSACVVFSNPYLCFFLEDKYIFLYFLSFLQLSLFFISLFL